MVTHQQDLKVCEQAGGGTLSLPDRKGEFIKDILSHGNKMSVAGGRRVSDAAVAELCCLVPLWLSLLSLDTGPCPGLGVVQDGWSYGLGFEGR